jgi:hypothetical protein
VEISICSTSLSGYYGPLEILIRSGVNQMATIFECIFTLDGLESPFSSGMPKLKIAIINRKRLGNI